MKVKMMKKKGEEGEREVDHQEQGQDEDIENSKRWESEHPNIADEKRANPSIETASLGIQLDPSLQPS